MKHSDLGRFAEAERYAMQSFHQEEEYFRSAALVILGIVRQAATAVKLLHEAIASAQNLDDKYSEAYGGVCWVRCIKPTTNRR